MDIKKQEVIAEAWGDIYGSMKNSINENGWLNRSSHADIFKNMSVGSLDFMGQDLVRPSKLKGIDNNQGWIKLENESLIENLEIGFYFVFNNNPDVIWMRDKIVYHSDDIKSLFERGCITHIQKVVMPREPIY